MLPWGHAAVGYLLYTVVLKVRSDRQPIGGAVLALAVGTQFPDLVDKPLGWHLGVLPSGRSLGHSLITAVLLIGAVHWLASRYGHRLIAPAFGIGYLSHLATDGVYALLSGNVREYSYLLWPITHYADAGTELSILEKLLAASGSPTGLFELGLFIVATALWISHRAPGLDVLLATATDTVRRFTP